MARKPVSLPEASARKANYGRNLSLLKTASGPTAVTRRLHCWQPSHPSYASCRREKVTNSNLPTGHTAEYGKISTTWADASCRSIRPSVTSQPTAASGPGHNQNRTKSSSGFKRNRNVEAVLLQQGMPLCDLEVLSNHFFAHGLDGDFRNPAKPFFRSCRVAE